MTEDSPDVSQPSTRDSGVATQQPRPERAGNEENGGSRTGRPWLAKAWAVLHVSLSRAQMIVGLAAGIVSIIGALYSVTQFFRPGPGMGEVVALVKEAKSQKTVSDATIEILTPQNALVATLTPDSLGRAHRALKEGTYRVRASHPRFAAEVRQIQVISGHTVEVRLLLRAGTSSPLAEAERAISKGLGTVRRAFGF